MPTMNSKSKIKNLILIALLCLLLAVAYGCSRDNGLIPVPIGNLKSLENLADSYSKLASQNPANITSAPPFQKREFVERVFSLTGYDYTQTLLNMAETELDPKNKNQKDLAELLLLPTVGMSSAELADAYPDDQVTAIKKIKATF